MATKIENLHLTAGEFTGKISNCKAGLIPEIEFALLEALGFNIHYFHPHSALAGLFLDLQEHCEGYQPDWTHSASLVLDLLVTTDAVLVETPSHLAFAAVHQVASGEMEAYVKRRLSGATDVDALLGRIRDISETYGHLQFKTDTPRLKDIDRRLVLARTSLADTSTAMQLD